MVKMQGSIEESGKHHMESQQVFRASTPASKEGTVGSPYTLTPAMADRAAARLGWVSMAFVLTVAVGLTMQVFLQPENRLLRQDGIFSLSLVAIILFAVGLVVVQRLKLLPSIFVLNLGMIFEVLVAWFMGYAETFLPLHGGDMVRGAPMVALWLAFVALLVRHTPLVTLLTAVAGATMWPLAYFFNVWQHGYQLLPWNRLAMWLFAPYMSACWVYLLTKRVFRLETQAQKAEDLGSYRLVYRIGEGGMGEVWRARHRLLARDAAIKIIRGNLANTSAFQADVLRKRFEREARVMASLECPHTVSIFDFGVTSQGEFYYVMELLNGISLQALVEHFGPQPAGRVVHLMKHACKSLEEAHRKGMVHRDIKPANIFSAKVGLDFDFAKVLDFGLVKCVNPAETAFLTQGGFTAGTPAYMAPEAALGAEKVDGRLDLYSLGCVAYVMLTGRLVFEETNSTATALAHVQKEPVPPSQRTELPVPVSLDRLVLRCLAKSPGDRPDSAAELIELLEACDGVEPWTGRQAEAWWLTHLPEIVAGVAATPSGELGATIEVS
jgi:serine/threonine-protein kinase